MSRRSKDEMLQQHLAAMRAQRQQVEQTAAVASEHQPKVAVDGMAPSTTTLSFTSKATDWAGSKLQQSTVKAWEVATYLAVACKVAAPAQQQPTTVIKWAGVLLAVGIAMVWVGFYGGIIAASFGSLFVYGGRLAAGHIQDCAARTKNCGERTVNVLALFLFTGVVLGAMTIGVLYVKSLSTSSTAPLSSQEALFTSWHFPPMKPEGEHPSYRRWEAGSPQIFNSEMLDDPPVSINAIFVGDYEEHGMESFGDFPQRLAESILNAGIQPLPNFRAIVVQPNPGGIPTPANKTRQFAQELFDSMAGREFLKGGAIFGGNVHYFWIGKGIGSVVITHMLAYAHELRFRCQHDAVCKTFKPEYCTKNPTDTICRGLIPRAFQGQLVAERSVKIFSLDGVFDGYAWHNLPTAKPTLINPNPFNWVWETEEWGRDWSGIPRSFVHTGLNGDVFRWERPAHNALMENLLRATTSVACYAAPEVPKAPSYISENRVRGWSLFLGWARFDEIAKIMNTHPVHQNSAFQFCTQSTDNLGGVLRETALVLEATHQTIGNPHRESQLFKDVRGDIVKHIEYAKANERDATGLENLDTFRDYLITSLKSRKMNRLREIVNPGPGIFDLFADGKLMDAFIQGHHAAAAAAAAAAAGDQKAASLPQPPLSAVRSLPAPNTDDD